MEVKLKVCVGAAAGKELPIPGPKFFIGRAEDCNLRPKSDLISRHHCVLMFEGAALIVRDLGSRNGTLVNDERVVGEIELNHGDHLKVGPLEFEVLIYLPKPNQKLPKVNSIKEAAARTAAGRETETSDPSEWLDDSDSAGLAPPAHELPSGPTHAETETREISANETEEIDLAATLMDLPTPTKPAAVPKERPDLIYKPDPPADEATPSPDEIKRTDPGKPGKLPIKPRSADSRAAATDVLKKFFHRR